MFSYRENPESIENNNIRFYIEQKVKYENICIELNKLFVDSGICNSTQRLFIQPVYDNIYTHVTYKKVNIIKELKATIFWLSPRGLEYSCWHNISLIGYDIQKDEIHKFLMNQFINQNISEWKKLDPHRIL